jgi:hypothetical protein
MSSPVDLLPALPVPAEGDWDGDTSDGEAEGPPGLLPASWLFSEDTAEDGEDAAEEDEGDEDSFIEEILGLGLEPDPPPGLVTPGLMESSPDSEDGGLPVLASGTPPRLRPLVTYQPLLPAFLAGIRARAMPELVRSSASEGTGDEEDGDVQIYYSDDYTDEE